MEWTVVAVREAVLDMLGVVVVRRAGNDSKSRWLLGYAGGWSQPAVFPIPRKRAE